MTQLIKRFYETVTVEQEREGYCISLDNNILKSPQKKHLNIKSHALATMIKQEWEEQKDTVRIANMPITRLMMGFTDISQDSNEAIIDSLEKYAHFDELYYFAEFPNELHERQIKLWQPVLQYVEKKFNIHFLTTMGIRSIKQSDVTLMVLRNEIKKLSPEVRFAFNQMTQSTGSLILSFNVLYNKNLDNEKIWELSQLDYLFYRDIWGHDEEAHIKYINDKRDFMAACAFCMLNYA